MSGRKITVDGDSFHRCKNPTIKLRFKESGLEIGEAGGIKANPWQTPNPDVYTVRPVT